MKTVVLVPLLLVIGVAIGLAVGPAADHLIPSASDDHQQDDIELDDQEEHEEDHVALSREGFQNLNLRLAPIKLSNYTRMMRMPGNVVELPGRSAQKVAAPVNGVVTRVFAVPGVSVSPGDPLFELQIVDDQLTESQLRLVELITKREIVSAERLRLGTLVSAGAIPGRKKLELDYQQRELDSSLSVAEQELLMRGLSDEQVATVRNAGQLLADLVVETPALACVPTRDTLAEVAPRETDTQLVTWNEGMYSQQDFTVEELFVEPGQSVTRGSPLCNLAAHAVLCVSGHAFENEIDLVSKLAAAGRPVSVEFGIAGNEVIRDGLSIRYVLNHVDESARTFRFFVPLPNEVLGESRDALGRRFRTWRHKVGQRVHVLIPADEIPDHIVLPSDAVVREGPDAFVFREHLEESESGVASIAGGVDAPIFIELEPVPVTVIRRDNASVVVVPGGDLSLGDRVAMTGAYQLLLAMKSQAEGSGGHDHHHHH